MARAEPFLWGFDMTRWFYLAATLLAVVGVEPAAAQFDVPGVRTPASRAPDDPKPVYKYELKPENGEFLVCVRSFIGKTPGDRDVKERAESFAEWVRTECRLYAFVYERGWLMRRERDKEKENVIDVKRKYYAKEMGVRPEEVPAKLLEVKMARLPDDYAVFVAPGKGSLKNMDEAIDFAKYVHKLPCPPADFCDAVVVGASSVDVARQAGESRNPFPMAMPCRNPTLPKKEVTAATRPKADDFLLNLNAGQKYSLIHKTRKDFTLVVKTYGGQFGQVFKPGEVKQVGGKSDGEMLERAAQQANGLCDVLRGQRDPSYDAFVLHTRYESFVCIGEYDSKDDPELVRLAGKLAHMGIKDKKTGDVIETLMDKPLPAMIPRP
jgi:hypothetical protein